MKCPNCGSDLRPGARFCGLCGATLAAASPVAFAASSSQPPGQDSPSRQGGASPPHPERSAEPARRQGRGCCGLGCMLLLILLGMLVLLGGVGAAVYFKVPQRLGLVQSPAAQAFSGTPDRQAASAVKQELAKAGIDTIGMEIFVLPVTGKESSVAYALLDAGQGFRFKSGAGRDVLIDYMTRVGSSEAAKQSGVDRVALEYRGKNGQKLVSLTATTETISGFAKGTLSRPQFLQKLDGDANWPAFYQETMEVFN